MGEDLNFWEKGIAICLVCMVFSLIMGAILGPFLAFSTQHTRVFVYNPTTEEVRALLEGDKVHNVVLVDLEESCLSDGTVVVKTIYSNRNSDGYKSLNNFLELVGVDYSMSGSLGEKDE